MNCFFIVLGRAPTIIGRGFFIGVDILEFDKPYKTPDERLDILRTRGLEVTNKNLALHAFEVFSYYDLINGYKPYFCPDDKFDRNINIDFLVLFHLFDRSFLNLLLKYSLSIENTFKNILADVVASTFGISINDYLNKTNLVLPRENSVKLDACIDKLLFYTRQKNKSKIDQPCRHYLDKTTIPPWILFKNASFSQAIDYYSFLKKDSKDNIVSRFSLNTGLSYEHQRELFKKSLNYIRKSRNKIAHNLSFLSLNIEERYNLAACSPVMLKKFYEDEFVTWKEIKTNDGLKPLFTLFNVVFAMLNSNLLRVLFIDDLKALVDYFRIYETPEGQNLPELYLSITGFPNNFMARADKCLVKKISANPLFENLLFI